MSKRILVTFIVVSLAVLLASLFAAWGGPSPPQEEPTAVGAELAAAAVDEDDSRQVAIYKTVQVLTNQVIYADSYLSA